jgi:hypothetical protein
VQVAVGQHEADATDGHEFDLRVRNVTSAAVTVSRDGIKWDMRVFLRHVLTVVIIVTQMDGRIRF